MDEPRCEFCGGPYDHRYYLTAYETIVLCAKAACQQKAANTKAAIFNDRAARGLPPTPHYYR